MMKTLVITGGIGSGKSQVCRILRDMGMNVQYNADSRVKALYTERPELLNRIEDSLGVCFRDSNGNFLPKKLSEIIFEDAGALETVESLVFPVLIEDFKAFAAAHHDEKIIIFESATILEKPFFDGFADRTILVDAPYSMRLERACARDGASEEAVKARMANQPLMNSLSGGHADPRIDAVIMNDSGLEELYKRTEKVILNLFDN